MLGVETFMSFTQFMIAWSFQATSRHNEECCSRSEPSFLWRFSFLLQI